MHVDRPKMRHVGLTEAYRIGAIQFGEGRQTNALLKIVYSQKMQHRDSGPISHRNFE